MGEVVFFDAASRCSSSSPLLQTQQIPYETYAAYQQADAAFRALYFGRRFDLATIKNRPSNKIAQRHWSTVQRLAETLIRQKSLSREQTLKLLLNASLELPIIPDSQ